MKDGQENSRRCTARRRVMDIMSGDDLHGSIPSALEYNEKGGKEIMFEYQKRLQYPSGFESEPALAMFIISQFGGPTAARRFPAIPDHASRCPTPNSKGCLQI
jgi:hypothetical protein